MAKNKGQNTTPSRPEPNAPLVTESSQSAPANQSNRPVGKKGPGPQNRGGSSAH
jgi:hypothetical protein